MSNRAPVAAPGSVRGDIVRDLGTPRRRGQHNNYTGRTRDNEGWGLVDRTGPDFRDSDDFKAYAERIESIVYEAGEPGTIRFIHERLGPDNVRREWTLDALEQIKTVDRVEGLIDKYRVSRGAKPMSANVRWVSGDIQL